MHLYIQELVTDFHSDTWRHVDYQQLNAHGPRLAALEQLKNCAVLHLLLHKSLRRSKASSLTILSLSSNSTPKQTPPLPIPAIRLSNSNTEYHPPARTMQIVRLVEDYTPDATAHVIPKQILHKKDLLLRVYPAEDGWVIVKPLQSTTSDPSWVPEKLIKPASPGLYRARSDIAHPLESRSISAGEIVKVIDTRPSKQSPCPYL